MRREKILFTLGLVGLLSAPLISIPGARAEIKGTPFAFVKEKAIPLSDGLACFAVSPDGKYAAVGTQKKSLVIFNLDSGAVLRSLPLRSNCFDAAFTPDGKFFAATDRTRSKAYATVWEVRGFEVAAVMSRPTGNRKSPFARISKGLGEPMKMRSGADGSLRLGFSPDGKTLATSSFAEKTVTLWDWKRSKILKNLRTKNFSPETFVFAPDGKEITVGGARERVRRRTQENCAKGDRCYTTEADKDQTCLRVWDVGTGKIVEQIRTSKDVWRIAITPDGNKLAAALSNGDLMLLDMRGQKLIAKRNFAGSQAIDSVAFSPDGTRLITGNKRGDLGFLDIQSANPWVTMTGFPVYENNEWAFHVAFTEDSRYLITAVPTEIVMWDGRSVQKGFGDADEGFKNSASRNIAQLKILVASDPYFKGILGVAYRRGFPFVRRNPKKALEWLGRAADEGHPFGFFNLGVMHEEGVAVEKDPVKAQSLYARAVPGLHALADSGDAEALFNLGYLEKNGYGGVEKNAKAAAQHYLEAARKDHAVAQFSLAHMYSMGEGGLSDKREARKWFERSAEQGYPPALAGLAKMHRFGWGGLPADVSRAASLYRKAALSGSVEGLRRLGDFYQEGTGVPANDAVAMVMYYWAGRAEPDGFLQTGGPDLDKKTGLRLMTELKWHGSKSVPLSERTDKKLAQAMEAFSSGLPGIGTDLLRTLIKDDGSRLYMENFWFTVYSSSLPLSLAGDLLRAVKAEKFDRADFWFTYAHAANLAGKPELALPAVKKLQSLANREPDAEYSKKLDRLSAILNSISLMQMGQEKEAYLALYNGARSATEDPAITNYINHWGQPLFKDEKKLSFCTGIAPESLTGSYRLPEPQDFPVISTRNRIETLFDSEPADEVRE